MPHSAAVQDVAFLPPAAAGGSRAEAAGGGDGGSGANAGAGGASRVLVAVRESGCIWCIDAESGEVGRGALALAGLSHAWGMRKAHETGPAGAARAPRTRRGARCLRSLGLLEALAALPYALHALADRPPRTVLTPGAGAPPPGVS